LADSMGQDSDQFLIEGKIDRPGDRWDDSMVDSRVLCPGPPQAILTGIIASPRIRRGTTGARNTFERLADVVDHLSRDSGRSL
jgi:hypothetical protein